MRLILLALFSAAVLSVSAEQARFDNYRVMSVKIANEEQRAFLAESDELAESVMVVSETGSGIEIVVAPHKFADVSDLFERNGIESEVTHENLQELIDNEQPAVKSDRFTWTQYHNVDVIHTWLDQKLKEFPRILRSVVVGRSFENRTIRGVRLSHKAGNPVVLIDAAIHAREWIAPATATFFLNQLLTSRNPAIVDLARNIDWIIVPVFNVDGYSWSHTNFRMWRKTRQRHSTNPDPRCVGADPNRNFDIKWGSVGTSTNPCTDIFGGPRPFSEPETVAMSRYMRSIRNLRMYLTFHAFGQYVLFPPGYRGPNVPHHNHLMQVGLKAAEGFRKRYGSPYRVGPIATTLSAAAGGSDDWAYANTNASLTYCFELRDRGRFGFILPANQIVPNSLETTDGIVALVAEARKLNYL